MATPISGRLGKVEFGAGPTILGVSKWSLKKMVKIIEAPNTSDGMKRVLGLSDAEGTVEGPVDTAADLSGSLDEGDIVTLKLYTDGTKFYSLSAIIEDIEFTSEIEGLYEFKLSFKLASGTVTVPV